MTPYQRGKADYAAGRDYPPEYERWNDAQQHSYENGRLREATAAAKVKNERLAARRGAAAR